jgi:hypothetical protein
MTCADIDVIKNVVLIGAGIVIGATVHGGAVVADPKFARVAVQMEKRHEKEGS